GVSDLSTLGIWVCARRSIGPRRARVQRRGRPISEKALVILECNEAFENTELSPWNAQAHLPSGRREPRTAESLDARRVRCRVWFGTHPGLHSKIPSYSVAILLVFLTVVFPQEFLFAQYLPVDQPNPGNEVDQPNPIGEHQDLS